VIWLLRSRDVEVRRMGIELAQTVPDPHGELWPKLLDHLRDEDWWVRERVADVLAEVAGDKLLRQAVGYLQDPSDIIRRFAVEVLIKLKNPSSLGALVRTAQSDTDWLVRERAIEGIAALKDERAVPHVIDLMLKNRELQIVCLQALGELKDKSAAPHVAGLLGTEDLDLKLAALRCLMGVNDPSQAAAVQPLLRDATPAVRDLAREMLGMWQVEAGAQQASARSLSALDQLLVAVAQCEGDDLILSAGRVPYVKRLGKTQPLAKNVLSSDQIKGLIYPRLSYLQRLDLEALRDVDFSYEVKSEGLRFRSHAFQDFGGFSAVFRIIKGTLMDLDKLGLPPIVRTFSDYKNGLVLIGGPTGSGKSTTLAALIDQINRAAACHIISLEDPIEVVHHHKKSLINQREIGTHAMSFAGALRATLREDPDVILIGEMRDYATISFAVSAAETGHLVFGSVHTSSAAATVDRLINACPPNQQDHMRTMIAGSLRAVACQFLMKRIDAPGRCLAVEVLLNNDAVENLIRKGKTFQVPSVIATSREQGMQQMDQELMRLHREGKISAEEAYMKAVSKKDFESLVEQGEEKAPVKPTGAKAGVA